MSTLRKNIAGQFFYFQGVKASDGTAFSDAITTRIVSKDGAAQATMAGTATHLSNGLYVVAPTQADTNADYLGFSFGASGMIPVTACFITVGYDPHAAALAANTTYWQGVPTVVDAAGKPSVGVEAWAGVTGAVKNGATSSLPQMDVTAWHDRPMAGAANMIESGTGSDRWTAEALSQAPSGGGGGLTQQQVRDSMKLAPTAGAPAAGSVDLHLDEIQGQTDKMQFSGSNEIKSDVAALDGDTTAATRLRESIKCVTAGTVGAGSTTTVIEVSFSDPAMTVDNLKGLVVKFQEDTTTAALKGQGGPIASNTATAITLSAPLTAAPVSGDLFVVN